MNQNYQYDQIDRYAVIQAFHQPQSSQAWRCIYFQVLDRTYTYKVDQIKLVLPDELDYLKPEAGKDLATLVICYPYVINSHRMLVRGHRIRNIIPEPNVSNANYTSLFMIAAAALIIIISFTGRKKDKTKL